MKIIRLSIFVLLVSGIVACTGSKKGNVKMENKSTTEVIKDSSSYALGVLIGSSLKQQGLSDVDLTIFTKAIEETLAGKAAMEPRAAQQIVEQKQKLAAKAKEEANIKVGKDFLAKNAKKKGVVTLPSGLQYIILKKGDGAVPTASDKVKTHYHGTLLDGTVFDSSVDRGEPISFPVGGVIQGWQEALQLMPVGSKWKLFVPSDLAYGQRSPSPAIGPNETLIFEVELLGIE